MRGVSYVYIISYTYTYIVEETAAFTKVLQYNIYDTYT